MPTALHTSTNADYLSTTAMATRSSLANGNKMGHASGELISLHRRHQTPRTSYMTYGPLHRRRPQSTPWPPRPQPPNLRQ